jgi:predicted ester cyclase
MLLSRERSQLLPKEATMTPSETKALIQRWVNEVWNEGKPELISELMPTEYVLHVQNGSETVHGPDGFRAFWEELRIGIPDFHLTLGDVLVEGDTCAWRFSVTGTHLGQLYGVAPTGRSLALGGIVVSRFHNNRWVEDWACWDALAMLQQIGAVPTTEAAGTRA